MCVGLSPACSPPGKASEASEVFCARNTIRFLLWESRLEHLTLFFNFNFYFLHLPLFVLSVGQSPSPAARPTAVGTGSSLTQLQLAARTQVPHYQ